MEAKYPNCEVHLLGTHAHPISIFMKVKRGLERHLREQGIPADEVSKELETLEKDLMPGGGDVDESLQAAFRWVTVS